MQSFSELSLSAPLLRAINELGFTTPSPIQSQALPLLLAEPTDFLGLAGTGTGKTAAFAIPMIERINSEIKAVQGIVLCPTRELAMQVAGQIDLLGKFKRVRTVTVYGGSSFSEQLYQLKCGAQILVGTPGRVIDHIKRGTLKLDQVKVLVLDEADEMFSMGFKDELDTIIASVPADQSNTWLFSATMSPEVRRIAQNNLRAPKTVQVNRTEMLSSGVEQYFYRAQESEKPEMICKLIEAADDFYGLIFCQTKALVADLHSYLADRGYRVDCLHGDKDQTSREHTMQAFRDRKVQILVCTDVASRGLDVKDITHVVNYSLPREMESYVHRIGRTARSGKTGIVMNLVTASHRQLIGRIEYHTKVPMKEGFVPTVRQIGAKKVAKLLPRFEDQPFHTRVLEVMGEDFKQKLATMTSEQVAAHFIALMMPDVFGGGDSHKTKRTVRLESAPAPVAQSARPVAPRAATPAAKSESAKTVRPIEPSAPVLGSSRASSPIPSPAKVDGPVVFDAPSVERAPVHMKRSTRPKNEQPLPKSKAAQGRPEVRRLASEAPRAKKVDRVMAVPGTKPKHDPGQNRTGELNRRARRAAVFGNASRN